MAQELYQGQTLRQEQTLAPQQLQSLEVLTVPLMELENKIDEELMSNPVLELAGEEAGNTPADSGEGDPELPDPDRIEETGDSDEADPYSSLISSPLSGRVQEEGGGYADSNAAPDLLDANRDDFSEGVEKMLESDGGASSWSDFMPEAEASLPQEGHSTEEDQEKRQFLFDSIPEEPSFQEQLMEQLRFSDCPDELRKAAEEIIGSIDNSGYLQTPLADISQSTGCSMDTVEKALHLVQGFDPAGIGARNLIECLLLQLKRQGRGDSKLADLVRYYLQELARNKLPQIAKSMGISVNELNDLVAELKTLNPHPGAAVAPDQPLYVVPEVTVVPDGDEFKVIQNRERMPRLMISSRYLRLLEDPNLPDDAKSYIRQKLNSGKLLIKSLEQRQSTILRIAELVVSAQHDFLREGPSKLKPMTMQYIADRIGLHETTISRAIANKYIQTPVGLFEFKYFFTGGYQSESGDEVSSRGIKELIREIVGGENPASPLSDNKIMNLLKERGFDVARRTIAKYREELGIQSSSMRRTF